MSREERARLEVIAYWQEVCSRNTIELLLSGEITLSGALKSLLVLGFSEDDARDFLAKNGYQV